MAGSDAMSPKVGDKAPHVGLTVCVGGNSEPYAADECTAGYTLKISGPVEVVVPLSIVTIVREPPPECS